jgi:putative heme-binding domain-containing protein
MAIATAATVESGKTLFEQSCASCHSMDGSGASYGPDLKTVTQRRDRDWLVHWIAAPEKVIESGDAIAQELVQKYNGVPMPNAGLQPDQVESIVSYLENAAGTASAVPQKTETAAAIATQPVTENLVGSNSVGDAVTGQKLFAGTIPFQNGGPACMSCHTVNVVGALRGGTLGPNLTHVIDRYTEAGLKGVLPTLPYPTMQGIYQNKLLTEAEQAHLLAFFNAANQSETGNREQATGNSSTPVLVFGLPDTLWAMLASLLPGISSTQLVSFQLSCTWKFILLGLGGFLLLALLSQITWRDRLTGVRQRLVEGQKS